MTRNARRTDRHTPSNLIPSEYRFRIAFAYPGNWPDMGYNVRESAEMRIAHLASGGTVFSKPNGAGGCHICGAHFRHGAWFVHESSHELIQIGWQCAEKLDFLSGEVVLAQKAAKKATMIEMGRALKIRKRRTNLRIFATESTPELRKALRVDHRITKDIRARFIANANRWASLTPKQEKLVLDIAARASEPKVVEVNVPAPEGRQVIQGTIVSLKWKATDFGDTLKMTVKVTTPDGVWLAWGTCPRALANDDTLRRGLTVKFTGTLTRSSNAHFAFFKRPTKASVVKAA